MPKPHFLASPSDSPGSCWMGWSALWSSGRVLDVVRGVWFREGSWGTQVLCCRRAPEALVSAGRCACDWGGPSQPSWGCDSSERWHWLCIPVALGDHISHGEDLVLNLVLAVQMKGSGLVSKDTRFWGKRAAVAPMNLWCAPPWEQDLKPGSHGSLLFGNILGYRASLVLFSEPPCKGNRVSLLVKHCGLILMLHLLLHLLLC